MHPKSQVMLIVVLLVLLAAGIAYYLFNYEFNYSNQFLAEEATANLIVNNESVGKVYIAATIPEKMEGLMFVKNLSNGYIGMLFPFGNTTQQCFWMKNTSMHLYQYWVINGTVALSYNATPYSTNIVCSEADLVIESPSLRLGIGNHVNIADIINASN